MSNFRAAIESRIGPTGSDFVDTTPTLSRYYGPNSLACHGLRRLDKTHIESYFIVPENLCGPQARPPMFNSFNFQTGTMEAVTSTNDALEHFIDGVFIDDVPIKLVPGHNLAGLVVEAMDREYSRIGWRPLDLRLTGFSAIRYMGFVLPGQRISLTGEVVKDAHGATFSPDITVNGQVRARAINFRSEIIDPIDEVTRNRMLAQHWLLETTAQGFGCAAALGRSVEGLVPVLMQGEKTIFDKSLIIAGDLITTRFELLSSSPEQGFGNAEIFVNGNFYGSQRRLMVQFFPIKKIAEGIKSLQNT